VGLSQKRQTDFVAYIDAIGYLDRTRCLIEWETTTSRCPGEPEGLLTLNLQLTCCSWIRGISEMAMVVFVRKRISENPVPVDMDHRRAARGVRPVGQNGTIGARRSPERP